MMTGLRHAVATGDPDRGSALVAAIGVALIGMALATVVVSATIVGARDSGRDRASTLQVHSAEGGVDAVFSQLETGTPCTWPATGLLVQSTSPSATSVTASVSYWDASGTQLPCSAGVVTGSPTSAVVTATATTSNAASVGRPQTRTVQAKVNLTPLSVPGHGSAIFAASSIVTTNGFTLTTSLPDTPVDVWVDSGNVDCNSGVTIDGNLIVVQGTTSISNRCRITKNLWSKGKFTVNSARSDGLTTVGLNAYSAGGASIAGGVKIGGDLIVAGTWNTWGGGPLVGGLFRTGAALSEIPQYVPVGLPEVNYKPADWTGFANSGDRSAAYRQWVAGQAAANGATDASVRSPTDPHCTVAGPSWGINGTLTGPSVATVFDARSGCSTTTFQALTIKLRADMVIYTSSATLTNGVNVVSGDGAPHKIWIISPDPDLTPNGVADCNKTVAGYKPGTIKTAAGSSIVSPITVFMYTPCSIETNNTTDLSGQLYGGSVTVQNAMTLRYVPIGIPGVTFPSNTPTVTSGNRVDIVYTREIKTPAGP